MIQIETEQSQDDSVKSFRFVDCRLIVILSRLKTEAKKFNTDYLTRRKLNVKTLPLSTHQIDYQGQSGFGLMQVVVAMTLSSVVMLGIFQGLQSAQITQARTMAMNDYNDAVTELRTLLRNEPTCTGAFQNINIQGATGTLNTPQEVAMSGQTIQGLGEFESLKYRSIQFMPAARIELLRDDGGNRYAGRIFFVPQSVVRASIGGSEPQPESTINPRPIFASFQLSGGGDIQSCTSIDDFTAGGGTGGPREITLSAARPVDLSNQNVLVGQAHPGSRQEFNIAALPAGSYRANFDRQDFPSLPEYLETVIDPVTGEEATVHHRFEVDFHPNIVGVDGKAAQYDAAGNLVIEPGSQKVEVEYKLAQVKEILHNKKTGAWSEVFHDNMQIGPENKGQINGHEIGWNPNPKVVVDMKFVGNKVTRVNMDDSVVTIVD